jgi:hypothetical protein
LPQHEKLAICDRNNIGLPEPTRKQGHFAEKCPSANLDPAIRQNHFNCARSYKIDAVPAINLFGLFVHAAQRNEAAATRKRFLADVHPGSSTYRAASPAPVYQDQYRNVDDGKKILL